MNMTADNSFSIKELEALAQAYLDCRLSRLEEKELELILSCCELSSPLLDEVRCDMRIQTAIASVEASLPHFAPRKKFRSPRWVAAVACLLLIFCAGFFCYVNDTRASVSYTCVIINGKRLPADEARIYAEKAEAESKAEFMRIMRNAERKDVECMQRINSLKDNL